MKKLTREQLESITEAQIDLLRYLKAEILPVVESLKGSEFAGTLVMHGLKGVKTKHLALTAEAAAEVLKVLMRNGVQK